jgi:hypothetical protein
MATGAEYAASPLKKEKYAVIASKHRIILNKM